MFAREPVIGIAQHVVAELRPLGQLQRLRIGPDAEDFHQIDLARHGHEFRKPGPPAAAPLRPQHAFHFFTQTAVDGLHRLGRLLVVLKAGDVLVEIGRFGRTQRQGMHLRTGQAVEVVELHGRQWLTQRTHLGQLEVEFPALVIRTDDEDSHVALGRLGHADAVEVVHEVPVQVDVIELIAANRLGNHIRRRMGAEAHMTHAPLALELPANLQASAFAERFVEVLAVVDAMDGQQVHVVLLQVCHGRLEGLEELPRSRLGHDLGLEDHRLARILRQHRPQLHLRRTVAASGLDVMDAQFHGAGDGRFEIGLTGGGHLVPRNIRPRLLVAHAAAREDGHLNSGPAKTTVLHECEGCPRRSHTANLDTRITELLVRTDHAVGIQVTVLYLTRGSTGSSVGEQSDTIPAPRTP